MSEEGGREGGREGGGGREHNILSDYDFFLSWPGEWHWPYATDLKIMQASGTAWSTELKSDSPRKDITLPDHDFFLFWPGERHWP